MIMLEAAIFALTFTLVGLATAFLFNKVLSWNAPVAWLASMLVGGPVAFAVLKAFRVLAL